MFLRSFFTGSDLSVWTLLISVYMCIKERGVPMIELKHLGKTYETSSGSVTALRDIDLTIQDGEIFGVIGLSGAGKSTLVRCINLLERPTQGEVWIDGQELTRLPQKQLLAMRRNIGMIFQGFNLLEQRTVLSNVAFPLMLAGEKKDKAQARAAELLGLVGLSDKARSYPSQLSGGQKQRVAIARALAMKPDILCFDEPTSALDPELTGEVLKVIRQLARQRTTMVIVTHEMAFARDVSSQVVFMADGRICESGAPDAFFSSPSQPRTREFLARFMAQ